MAQKIGELRAELAQLQASYSEAIDSISKVIDTAYRYHDDWHPGAFRNCANPPCQLANRLSFKWSEVLT